MRVAVLIHEGDEFDGPGYVLANIVRVWRERGVEVLVTRGGPRAPEADACVLHVDLTVVPPAYASVAARYPRAINLATLDISKRRVSGHRVTRGDGCAGPVIVKTNLNFAGAREAQEAVRRGGATRAIRALRRRLPWTCRSELGGKDYRSYDSVRDVPWAVWWNPDLVVERFLPEQRDGFYWLRSWHFFGPRETMSIRWSTHPTFGSGGVDGWKFVPPDIPPVIREARRRLGFDFGKFDFAISRQGPVLFDANRTPTNNIATPEQLRWQAEELAPGLWDLLGLSPPAPAAAPGQTPAEEAAERHL